MGSSTIWGVQFGWICSQGKGFRKNGISISKCSNDTTTTITTRRHHFSLSLNPKSKSKPKPVEYATKQPHYVTLFHTHAHSYFAKIQQLVRSPIPFPINPSSSKFGIWLCVAIVIVVTAVRAFVGRKSRYKRPGSVNDLVRRGQLRYDTRGISRPLKYDDPFNNPYMKVSKNNSTIEMCGKQYRLAPVTLTQEQQAIHQRRRSRAYQWKRPTLFLKEGDTLPLDVDPDTIRWIPANHPFATTAADIDEDLAQNNVYQKHGVPFRIQAEHEALHRNLEALQNEQKLNKLVTDPTNGKDVERPFKSHVKSNDHAQKCSTNNEASDPNHLERQPSPEENPSH